MENKVEGNKQGMVPTLTAEVKSNGSSHMIYTVNWSRVKGSRLKGSRLKLKQGTP